MHLSSGRVDFISFIMPHDDFSTPGVSPTIISVEYRDPKTGEVDSKSIFAHPDGPAGSVLELCLLELTDSYVANMPIEQLKKLYVHSAVRILTPYRVFLIWMKDALERRPRTVGGGSPE